MTDNSLVSPADLEAASEENLKIHDLKLLYKTATLAHSTFAQADTNGLA